MTHRLRLLAAGLFVLGFAVLVATQSAEGGPSSFAFPEAPNGTPIGYVPITANTFGAATWGPPAFAADGGTVTLGGDVTGASTANTVGSISGSAPVNVANGQLSFGTTFSTTGDLRFPNNQVMLAARNAANSADIQALATDSSNNVKLDGPAGVSVGAANSTLVSIGGTSTTGGVNLTCGSSTALRGLVGSTQMFGIGQGSSDFLYLGAASDQLQVTPTSLSVPSATTAGATPATLTIATQGPNGSCNASGPCTPGSLNVNLATIGATGSPTEGAVTISRGGTLQGGFGPYPGFPTNYVAFWGGLNGTAQSAGNVSMYLGPSLLYVNTLAANVIVEPAAVGVPLGGPTLSWGNSFFGAATNLGYTEFAAATGAHNTQDALSVCWNDSEHMTTYSAKNFNVYPLGGGSLTTAHGLSYTCTITGRVVTAGTGTGCTFWATGAHGTPDTTFACTVRATGQLHGGVWSAYAAPYYIVCDVTGSTNPSTGTGPTNPVFTFSATTSTSPNEVTVQWAPFNDVCGTSAPVIDAQSRCCVEDN